MNENVDTFDRPRDKLGRLLYNLTAALAIFGGIVVGLVATMTTISITGRAAYSMPVPGDIELVEIGTSTAVFAFLPFCQLMRGNVIVDFFMTWAPQWVKASCDSLGTILYLAVGCILTWRLYYGTFDMYEFGEITGVLAIPLWYSFPYALLCMALLLIVILYTLKQNISDIKQIHTRSKESN